LGQDAARDRLWSDVGDERAKIQKSGIADERWYDSVAVLNARELLHGVSFVMH
jgi:hypothetical protein